MTGFDPEIGSWFDPEPPFQEPAPGPLVFPMVGAGGFWTEGDYREHETTGIWAGRVGGDFATNYYAPLSNRGAPLFFNGTRRTTSANVRRLESLVPGLTIETLLGAGDFHALAVIDLDYVSDGAGQLNRRAAFGSPGGNFTIEFWRTGVAGSYQFWAAFVAVGCAPADRSTFDTWKSATVEITAKLNARGRGRVVVQAKMDGGFLWIREGTSAWVPGDAINGTWAAGWADTPLIGNSYGIDTELDGTIRALGFFPAVQDDATWSDLIDAWAAATFAADSLRSGLWIAGTSYGVTKFGADGVPRGQWDSERVDLQPWANRYGRAATAATTPPVVVVNGLDAPAPAAVLALDAVADYLEGILYAEQFVNEHGFELTISAALVPREPYVGGLGTVTAQSPYAVPSIVSDSTGYFLLGYCDGGIGGAFVAGAYDGVARDSGGGPGTNDGWQMVLAPALPGSPVMVQMRLRGRPDEARLDIRVGSGAWVSVDCEAILVLSGVLRLFTNYSATISLDADVPFVAIDRLALTDAEADAVGAEAQALTGWSLGFSTSFTGSGDVALQPFTIAGAGGLIFSGSAAIALQRFALAAVAALQFTGTCALTLRSLTCSGAGGETFTGTCAIAVQRLALAGAGAESFAGTCAINLSRYAVTAAGAETFTGACAIALSRYALAGSGAETFTGTCAIAVQRFALAGSGTYTPQAITGTCAISVQRFAVAAAGLESFAGTCAIALVPYTFAGSGSYTPQAITGTAAIALSPFALAGAGQLVITGTAAITLASLALAAVGTAGNVITGSAAIALQPYALSAAGTYTPQPITGTGAIALAPYAAAGAGAESFVGAAAIALSSLSLSAAGDLRFTGTGALALAALALAAAAEERFEGSAALALASYVLEAGGLLAFEGTAAIELARLALAAAGGESFEGAAAIELARLAVNAAGSYTPVPITGTGALALAPYDLAAAGPGIGYTGTGAIGLAPYGVTGAGGETFEGSGAVALRPLAVAAAGALGFEGAAAITLRPLALAGAGEAGALPITGTGSIALAPFAVAGDGAERFEGTGAIGLARLAVAGSGDQRFEGEAVIGLSGYALEAAGSYVQQAITGEGAIALPGFDVSGLGGQTFTGTGSIELAPFAIFVAGYRSNSTMPAVPGLALVLTRIAGTVAPIRSVAEARQLAAPAALVRVPIVSAEAVVLLPGRGIVKPSR